MKSVPAQSSHPTSMGRRQLPPDDSSDTDDSESEANHEVDDKNNEELQEDQTTTPDASECAPAAPPSLRFPFLKDYARAPSVSEYFDLTLGGSMSRCGDNSHLKTLQKLFPEWYDPKSSRGHQISKTKSPITATSPVSLTSRSNSPSVFSPSSLSISLTGRSSVSEITCSGKLLTIPKGNSLPASPLGVVNENLQQNEIQLDESMQETDYSTESHLERLYRLKNEGLDKQTYVVVKKENIVDYSSLHYERFRKIAGTTRAFTYTSPLPKENHYNQVTSDITTQTKQKGLTTIGCLKTLTSNPRQIEPLSPGYRTGSQGKVLHRWKTFTTTRGISYTPTFPPSCATTPRDKKSSLSSQGRRGSASTLERLLSDVSDVPSVVGLEGLFQRRRKVSKRVSDSALLACNAVQITHTSPALDRFYTIGRTVRIITAVCLTLKSYVREQVTTDWSFVEMYLHLQKDMCPDLAFNLEDFTKVEPPKGGRRLERLLSTPSHFRTPLDIQNTLAFLRTHETFQKFPPHVQVKLCRVMQYQSYEPQRIIMRQGHPPSAFYFVLSGSLIVNARELPDDNSQSFIRTIADVTEGQCFGEVALLEHVTRTASVVCKTQVELLVVYKEDFDELILRPLLGQRTEDVHFCVNHVLFEELSADVLYNNPDDFFYQHFPKGTVIAKDSLSCPFIVLVKSGACQIVGSYKRWGGSDGSSYANTPQELAHVFPHFTELMKIGLAKRVDAPNQTVTEASISKTLEVGILTGSLDKHTKRMAEASVRPKTTNPELHKMLEVPSRSRSYSLSQAIDTMERAGRDLHRTQICAGDSSGGHYWSKRLSGSRKSISRKSSSRSKVSRKSELWRVIREEDLSYAELAVLHQGCVFGLETMVGSLGPSVSLVSMGAECLMVSKQLFLQHANIKSLRVAGDLVMTYPSPESLHTKVVNNKRWENYKKDLVQQVTSKDRRT